MLKLLIIIGVLVAITAATHGVSTSLVVRREKRDSIAQTEYGRIQAVDINDGIKGPYHLQFITLDPNSLLLPLLLHADMVFYVQSGSGSLSWSDEDDTNQINLSKGDIYRIPSGSVFFVKSNLEAERERLRICSIFINPLSMENSHELYTGPYSTMPDLIAGFDTKVLQSAFQVSEEVIESIRNSTKSPPIVHVPSTNKTEQTNWAERILKILTGSALDDVTNKKKDKIFNILNTKPDFQNCNGWSKTANRKDLKALRGSNIGVFMVNLTEGAMMGPHWNPRASEIAIVLQGQGMVHVACSSMLNMSECKNRRFKVKEGDVFAVPRFHPMVQMAYNNETFVFMGFSTMARHNYPQFLAGKSSVLQTLDKDVLAMSFNVSNATVTELLSAQGDSVILGCVSCAEEEEMRMQEEIKKERQKEEEAKKKREEEERKREEEEARKKREEEQRKKREEEERKRQEEAARKKKEEKERRREEEEAEAEREAAEEAKRREEEEERKRHEEEAAQREAEKEATEAQRKQQEEEERKREEEEAEAQRKQQEQEEERRREEEEAQAEAQRKQQQQQEQRREEAEGQRKQEEEEEQRREEAAQQEQEEAARQEQEREERRRQEEEAQRQQEQGSGEEPGWGRHEGRRGGGGGGGFRKIFIF